MNIFKNKENALDILDLYIKNGDLKIVNNSNFIYEPNLTEVNLFDLLEGIPLAEIISSEKETD